MFGKKWLTSVCLLMLGLWLAWPAQAQTTLPRALVLTLEGPLTPAMEMYLERSLHVAQTQGVPLVVLKLNTPGGQVNLMENMIRLIRNSEVPVVVYVSPRGAMAASAGTLLTLAGHVGAMAPETAIGAASPITGEGQNLDSTADAKAKEVLRALARSLAAGRPETAIQLAEDTIEKARAVTAQEALDAGLIDVLAQDMPDLFAQIDGRTVQVNGQARTLRTSGLLVEDWPMSLLESVLSLLTNPTLVLILLTLGVQAIIIEFWTPGGWVAGFVGVVCLILAFFGLGMLPVNWFGVIFIVLAGILLVAEVATPTTFGVFVSLGALSFMVGALVLFNSPGSLPEYQINAPLVIGLSLTMLALSLAFIGYVVRSVRHQPVLNVGVAGLVGQVGEARTPTSAQIAGELWTVESATPLTPGDKVEVVSVRGLTAHVRKTPAD